MQYADKAGESYLFLINYKLDRLSANADIDVLIRMGYTLDSRGGGIIVFSLDSAFGMQYVPNTV